MIDLNLIHTFLEVTKTKNLRMAAQRLGVTQSAISQRIAALESQLGKSLFLRRGGMELNSVGQAFLKECAGYHENVTRIENWILSESGQMSGEVRMIATHGMIGRLFPDFLKEFLKQYPLARVSCVSVEASPQVEEQILSGQADLGLMVGLSQKPSMKTIKVLSNNCVLMVCAANHPLAKKKQITKRDLLSTRLLVHSHKGSRTQAGIFSALDFRQEDVLNIMRLPDMDTCKRHALAGLGVTFVANMYVYNEIRSGQLVALPGFKLKTPLYLISRNEKYEFPIVREFKKEFVAYCRELDEKWK